MMALSGVAAGCRARDDQPAAILEIEGRTVSLVEFERYVEESLPEERPFLRPELLSAMLEEFIDEQLLLRAAEDERIEVFSEDLYEELQATVAPDDEEVEVKEDSDLARRATGRLKVKKLIESRVLMDIDVTDEEVQMRYEEKRTFYRRPEMVEVSQVLLETEEAARELHAELAGRPGSFGEIARERSTGPEAERDGYMGAFRRGELPPSFEEQVFELRQGRISDVVQTDFGFHIFRVDKHIPASDLNLEEVSDAIRVELYEEKSGQALASFLQSLRERYTVTVYREHLNFPYLGGDNETDEDARAGRAPGE